VTAWRRGRGATCGRTRATRPGTKLLYADETGVFQQFTGQPNREAYFKLVYSLGDRWRDTYGPVARPASSATVWDVFNPNVYDGGALVLYALQQKIGTAKFQQLERAWVRKYRGKSASTYDFIALASRIAYRNLRTFLTAWLYGTRTPPMPGHPDWTVSAPATTAAPAGVAVARAR
jgi:hypothetical protein